jgi:hypothetical protein
MNNLLFFITNKIKVKVGPYSYTFIIVSIMGKMIIANEANIPCISRTQKKDRNFR